MSVYNPANDGFAAKVWECLRRNNEFKKTFAFVADSSRSEEEVLNELKKIAEEFQNKFAACVVGIAQGPPAISLKSPWSDLPDFLRVFLECSVGDIVFPQPHRISTPEELIALKETHDFIAVPQFFGAQTQDEVVAAITSLLRVQKHPRPLRPGGATLGSQREWSAYLQFERASENRNREDAILTASHLYHDRRTVASARDIGKKHKRHSDVSNWITRIEQCIDNVYPLFRPFDA